MSTLRKETEDITNYLRDEGYAVETIHECQWLNHKSKNGVIEEVLKKTVKIVRPRRNLNHQSILNGILTDELFGVLLCDIHTPDHLKEHFSEFCPIFKNPLVSANDVGPHMKAYAESHNIFRRPVKSPISSYFREKVFLITPLVRWYLQHGLRVTRIYQFSSTTQAKASRLLGRVFLTRDAQEMQTLPSQFLQNLQSLWATPVMARQLQTSASTVL